MAKMIKCPTCATQIEVPAAAPGQAATGQIVKCPGCGKQLKIVAKRPPGQGAGQTPGGVPSPGGSLAGGSLAGASVSGASVAAMSLQGSPSPLDDPPSLDAKCEVCGKAVEPEDLIEDNGRLKCGDCIKGDRSKIARSTVAPDLLDFKKAAANVRRLPLIHITPSFIAGAVAACVLIACQVYLTLVEAPKGKGRAMASIVQPTDIKPAPLVGDTTTQPTTEQSTDLTAAASTTQPVSSDATAGAPVSSTQAVAPVVPTGTNPPTTAATADAAATPGSALFPNQPPTTPETVTPATPVDTTSPAVASTTSPAVNLALLTSTDPLDQGIAKLQGLGQPDNKPDYVGAQRALMTARTKYVIGKLQPKLNIEQQKTLVGLAAACLGQNKPVEAKGWLDMVLGSGTATPARGTKTRSVVLDNAIYLLEKKAVAPREMGEGIDMLKQYLEANHGDEFAAKVFGTLLDHVAKMPNVKADQLMQYVTFLDSYADSLPHDKSGEAMWGVEWMDKNLVQQYRMARGQPANATPPADLQKELEAAEAKVTALQAALNAAKTNNADIVGAQNQLNAAFADEGRIQTQMKQFVGPAPKPKWLDKVEPVVPEDSTATQ